MSMRRRAMAFWMIGLAAAAGCADLEGPAGSADAGSDASTAADTDVASRLQGPEGWHGAAVGECDGNWLEVSWVADGDTLHLTGGDKVRFLGIDTPETTSNDCMAAEAKAFTFQEAPKGSKVCLSSDTKAGNKDNYGRLLRYVFVEKDGVPVMLNARLIRLGLARVYDTFAKGLRYENVLRDAQDDAKKAKAGGWASCGW